MTLLNLLAVVVILAAVGFCVGKWLFKKDTEIEDRRRSAGRLAVVLSKVGLVRTPEFLLDYAVGDYSGMAQKLKALVDLFVSGDDAVIAEFSKVFDNVLEAKLKSESGRAFIAAKLTDAAKRTDPSVVSNAPTAGVI